MRRAPHHFEPRFPFRSAWLRPCLSRPWSCFGRTGASVVARGCRRSQAKGMLERAGDALTAAGRAVIAGAGEFNYPESSRATSSTGRSAQAAAILPRDQGIEGGYLIVRFKSFLGTVLSMAAGTTRPVSAKERIKPRAITTAARRAYRRCEADLIDIQVDAAIRKEQPLFSVEELGGERPSPWRSGPLRWWSTVGSWAPPGS